MHISKYGRTVYFNLHSTFLFNTKVEKIIIILRVCTFLNMDLRYISIEHVKSPLNKLVENIIIIPSGYQIPDSVHEQDNLPYF